MRDELPRAVGLPRAQFWQGEVTGMRRMKIVLALVVLASSVLPALGLPTLSAASGAASVLTPRHLASLADALASGPVVAPATLPPTPIPAPAPPAASFSAPPSVMRPSNGAALAPLLSPPPDDPATLQSRGAYRRWRFFQDQRAYPATDLPDRTLGQARQQASQQASPPLPAGRLAAPLAGQTVTEGAWQAIGPRPIGSGAAGVGAGDLPNAGRVSALAVVDANIAYLGAASGGVWKTTNGGSDWTPLTDDQVSLAIGAIAVDPNNSNLVYAGLGEQNFCTNCYFGYGILKSTDAGATWTLSSPPELQGHTIGRLAVDPNNSSIVYAATTNGIARSNDGGATWTTVYLGGSQFFNQGNVYITDVAIDASTNPSTVYAAAGYPSGDSSNAVYRTTTNLAHTTANWAQRPGAGGSQFPTFPVGRIRLAIARGATTPTLYALVSDPLGGGFQGLYKTTDGGASWLQTTNPQSANPQGEAQTAYNLELAVYPTNASLVFALGVELYKSADGGANWALISDGNLPPYKIHVDQHAFGFIPGSGGNFYLGNDGGAYKSLDGGANFVNLNATLNTVQFWRGAVHPSDTTSALGGTQDNGTLSYQNALNWYRLFGGDGGPSAFDYTNPQNVYASAQLLNIFKSTTGPRGTFAPASNGIDVNEARLFIAPLVMDPTDPRTLYAGTTRLYRTTDGADTWSAISPQFSGPLSAIGVARGQPRASTLYAGVANPQTGTELRVSTDGGATWTNRSSGLPNRFITNISVDASDANVAYVSFSGFGAATPPLAGHVYRTADAGATWQDLSGNLPDAPVNGLALDSANGIVYIATDLGVYRAPAGSSTWTAQVAGLPHVIVQDIALNRDGTRLFAFSMGRGAFVADRTVGAPPATATATATASATLTPTATNTAVPSTATATPTVTPTATATATNTALPATATSTATSTASATATNTPVPPTATNTTTATATATHTTVPSTATSTATGTVLPASATATPTRTATPTASSTATASVTISPTMTNTSVPATATNTATASATVTATATNTALPATATSTASTTATATPTATDTALPAATSTTTPTTTSTATPTATSTPMPSTATNTPLPTATNTPLPSPTTDPVASPSVTPTRTPTLTLYPTKAVSAVNGSTPTLPNLPDVRPGDQVQFSIDLGQPAIGFRPLRDFLGSAFVYSGAGTGATCTPRSPAGITLPAGATATGTVIDCQVSPGVQTFLITTTVASDAPSGTTPAAVNWVCAVGDFDDAATPSNCATASTNVVGTATPTGTPTPTATTTPTATSTSEPTATATASPTAANTPLPADTSTATPTATATNTPSPTSTTTPEPTATNTVVTSTPTNTPQPTATNTPQPTATDTPSLTATLTALPTATETPSPTATLTPEPTATNTALPTATDTAVPTVTSTSVPTATNTPAATSTPTPTSTSTAVPTATSTSPPDLTATATAIPTNTALPTVTPSLTATPLPPGTAVQVQFTPAAPDSPLRQGSCTIVVDQPSVGFSTVTCLLDTNVAVTIVLPLSGAGPAPGGLRLLRAGAAPLAQTSATVDCPASTMQTPCTQVIQGRVLANAPIEVLQAGTTVMLAAGTGQAVPAPPAPLPLTIVPLALTIGPLPLTVEPLPLGSVPFVPPPAYPPAPIPPPPPLLPLLPPPPPASLPPPYTAPVAPAPITTSPLGVPVIPEADTLLLLLGGLVGLAGLVGLRRRGD